MLQVVVGHNGPTGLGCERHSPVGNDFQTVRGSEGGCPAASEIADCAVRDHQPMTA